MALCQKYVGEMWIPANNGFAYALFELPPETLGILIVPSTADINTVVATGVAYNVNYVNLVAAAGTTASLGSTTFAGLNADGDRAVKIYGQTKVGGLRTKLYVIALLTGAVAVALLNPGSPALPVTIGGNVQTVGGPTTSSSLASGKITGPVGGDTLVTLGTPNTGFYDVHYRVGFGGVAGTLIDNFKFWVGATFWRTIFGPGLGPNVMSPQFYVPRVSANAGDGVIIKCLNADAGAVYLAELDVVQVA